MPIPAIAIALGYALAGAIAQQAVNTATDTLRSPLAINARERLEKRLKTGKYGAIQKALEGGASVLLAPPQTDQQRQSIDKIFGTLLIAGPSPLLGEFSAQATQVYLLSGSGTQKTPALAKSYRRAYGPVAIVKDEVLDEATLTALFQAFFLAFRERLLQEPDFDYLRQYPQFVEERKQTGLQQEILDRLDTIAASLAKPVEDFSAVRLQYCQYLINALKDHTIAVLLRKCAAGWLVCPSPNLFAPAKC